MNKKSGNYTVVEADGKLYLYTPYAPDDLAAGMGYVTTSKPPGQPLTNKEALYLATTLLNYLRRKS